MLPSTGSSFQTSQAVTLREVSLAEHALPRMATFTKPSDTLTNVDRASLFARWDKARLGLKVAGSWCVLAAVWGSGSRVYRVKSSAYVSGVG